DPLDTDAQPRRLLAQIASDLSMRPLTALLVADPAQANPRLDFAPIPHRDPAHPFRLTVLHHRARRLLQQIPLLPISLRAHPGFPCQQALGAARTGLTAAQALLQQAVAFVAPVLARAQLSSGDDERLPFGRRDRRDVHLAEVHPGGVSGGQWTR